MGKKAYLSANERKDLVEFIASTGENYQRYLELCTQRGWTPFSEKYLHTWVQRRRARVQEMRAVHKEEVRRLSIMDKQHRMSELERANDIIKARIMETLDGEHECDQCNQPHYTKSDMIIKLIEQQRRVLEAIARERNEWQKDEKEDNGSSARAKLRDATLKALKSAQETKIIDGVYVVAKD